MSSSDRKCAAPSESSSACPPSPGAVGLSLPSTAHHISLYNSTAPTAQHTGAADDVVVCAHHDPGADPQSSPPPSVQRAAPARSPTSASASQPSSAHKSAGRRVHRLSAGLPGPSSSATPPRHARRGPPEHAVMHRYWNSMPSAGGASSCLTPYIVRNSNRTAGTQLDHLRVQRRPQHHGSAKRGQRHHTHAQAETFVRASGVRHASHRRRDVAAATTASPPFSTTTSAAGDALGRTEPAVDVLMMAAGASPTSGTALSTAGAADMEDDGEGWTKPTEGVASLAPRSSTPAEPAETTRTLAPSEVAACASSPAPPSPSAAAAASPEVLAAIPRPDLLATSAAMQQHRVALIAELERRKARLTKQQLQLQQEVAATNIFAVVRADDAAQLQYLLQQRLANVHERDYNGCTPLHVAASEGSPSIVRVLLSYGADALAVDRLGRTPLDCAAANRHSEVARYLLAFLRAQPQRLLKPRAAESAASRQRQPTESPARRSGAQTPSSAQSLESSVKPLTRGSALADTPPPSRASKPAAAVHKVSTPVVMVPPNFNEDCISPSALSSAAEERNGAAPLHADDSRAMSPAAMRARCGSNYFLSPSCSDPVEVSGASLAASEQGQAASVGGKPGSGARAEARGRKMLHPLGSSAASGLDDEASRNSHSVLSGVSPFDVGMQSLEDYRCVVATRGRAAPMLSPLSAQTERPLANISFNDAHLLPAVEPAAEAATGEQLPGAVPLDVAAEAVGPATAMDVGASASGTAVPPQAAAAVAGVSAGASVATAASAGDAAAAEEEAALKEAHEIRCSRYTTISDDCSLIVCMAGLPGRGKSFCSRRIVRYLNWKGVPCRVFNAGNYRRRLLGIDESAKADFFDPDNPRGKLLREKMAEYACEDIVTFLSKHDLAVGILDATNTTRSRRQWLREYFAQRGAAHGITYQLLFIESVCTDESIITENILRSKCDNDDFRLIRDTKAVIAEFRDRIANYEKVYETIEADEGLPFIKITNVKQHVVIHRVRNGLGSRIAFFLLNLHPVAYPVYIALPGETVGDARQLYGGDEQLTERGERYACALRDFIEDRYVLNMAVLHATNRSVMNTLRPLISGDAEPSGSVGAASVTSRPATGYDPTELLPALKCSPLAVHDEATLLETAGGDLTCVSHGDAGDLPAVLSTGSGSDDDDDDGIAEEVLCPVPGLDNINYGRFTGHTVAWVKAKYPRLSSLLDAVPSDSDADVPLTPAGHGPASGAPTHVGDAPADVPGDGSDALAPITFPTTAEAVQCLQRDSHGADAGLSYCVQFPNGESCRQVNVRLEPALLAVMRSQSPVFVVAPAIPAQGILAFFADCIPELSPTLQLPMHCVLEVGVKDGITVHPLLPGAGSACKPPPPAESLDETELEEVHRLKDLATEGGSTPAAEQATTTATS